MDFSWMVVMVVKPMSARARVVWGVSSRVEKGLRWSEVEEEGTLEGAGSGWEGSSDEVEEEEEDISNR